MRQPIRSDTVLPARRESLTLRTEDGLDLVGELALPAAGSPVATAVTLHPMPIYGGSMDNHLLKKMASRLPALAGLAVLRFNTRGHDGSEGVYGGGDTEGHDVAAALELVRLRELPVPWLVGWSFGTDMALRYGCVPAVRGAVLISPPLRSSTEEDLDAWDVSGKPLVCLVPELDDYLQPEEARRRFARVRAARVVEVAAAGHLLIGQAESVLDLVADALAPGSLPLAIDWDAPD